MAILIRFEDTYGMTDICVMTNLNKYIEQFMPIERAKELVKINSDIIVQSGMSMKFLFKLYDEDIAEIKRSNITDIIFVFDLDSWTGNKTEILNASDFNKVFYQFKNYIDKLGLSINLHFIPVMYAAETFYLYLIYDCIVNPCQIVSTYNTNDVHGKLVAAKLHKSSIKKIKNIRNELLKINIIDCLAKELNKNRFGNVTTLSWLLGNDLLCHTMNYDEFINYLTKANEFFKNCKVEGAKYINVTGKIVDINNPKSVLDYVSNCAD